LKYLEIENQAVIDELKVQCVTLHVLLLFQPEHWTELKIPVLPKVLLQSYVTDYKKKISTMNCI